MPNSENFGCAIEGDEGTSRSGNAIRKNGVKFEIRYSLEMTIHAGIAAFAAEGSNAITFCRALWAVRPKNLISLLHARLATDQRAQSF